MGFRMRKRIKIMPGVNINLSKSGASLSLGGKGATVNLSQRGTTTTLGIPGTGISYTSRSRSKPANQPQQTLPPHTASTPYEASMWYVVAAAVVGALIGGVIWGGAGWFICMLLAAGFMYMAGKAKS